MQNKLLAGALIVLLCIFVGVVVGSKKAKDSVGKEMLQQQSEIVRILKSLEESTGKTGGQDPAAFVSSLQDLQRRVTLLEAKLDQAAGALGQFGQRNAPPEPPSEDYTKVYDIPVDHSVIIGKQDAPVTIVEFVDFQCPFCARFHPPIKQVLAAYPNDVRYIIKNFPLSFHPQARPAAKAAFAAAEQGKYSEMVDAILQDNSNLSDEKYKELAQKIGLNADKFLKDYKDKDAQWEKWIEADIALGGQVDVQGTPTFFLNGKKTIARDFNAYKREIDAIIKR